MSLPNEDGTDNIILQRVTCKGQGQSHKQALPQKSLSLDSFKQAHRQQQSVIEAFAIDSNASGLDLVYVSAQPCLNPQRCRPCVKKL